MKDFMIYHLMQEIDAPSPCSAYTFVKLNGEDFGLYLAVEAVEDSFCYRNYGEDYGNIYKPDNFSMESLNLGRILDYSTPDSPLAVIERIMTGEKYKDLQEGERTDILYDAVYPIFSEIKPLINLAAMNYAGDNPETYRTIFDTSVFDITSGDKKSYINAVRNLNESDDPLSALDTDKLLRYFAVHHFVNNYDSYDSMFVHNFYVRENDGKLSLIPWDYNLAFGTFNYNSVVGSIMGENSKFDFVPNTADAMSPEKNMINYPIDTPCYSVDISERPLLYHLMNNPETLSLYHQYLDELISECFENGKYDEIYAHTYEIIRPYVEKGLTFYTVEKFDAGAETIHDYMNLRTKSIRGQLDGNIPSTTDGQKENPQNLIDTGNLNLARLVDFDSILAGISQENIMNILDIILENNFEYNTNGAVEAVHYYAENTDKLTGKIPEIIKIPFVKNMIADKISPFIEFIVAVILLVVALVFVRKYHRRKIYAVKT
ncbi:MAG: CotH kinase family protein [Ruminococcus flavefaciens]|nr:CotH kinase family protein [Ruminococcus flavefaciens]